MPNFINTRSLLAANVENLLENISIRRNAGKNEAEDLFGGSEVKSEQITWITDFVPRSKIEILLQEKESLGLYVSGHPLDDYRDLLQWCRDTSARDDIYIILIDKIKKIFTKTNSMMFVLQISVPEVEVEGIIFPKNALNLSPLLEEKELYWVKGKIQQSKKSQASKTQKKQAAETAEDGEEAVKEEGELKEYDELPKLIIDELVVFDEGILPLFAHEDIPMSTNRLNTLKKVNWKYLKTDPTSILNDQSSQDQMQSSSDNTSTNSIPTIFLPKSIGGERLKQIKHELKSQAFTGAIEVKVEVESTESIKKVKGSFWTTPEIVKSFIKS
jgi:DNA polymerase III alpha subunit